MNISSSPGGEEKHRSLDAKGAACARGPRGEVLAGLNDEPRPLVPVHFGISMEETGELAG